jgi:DnaK suppressor protein
MDILDSAKQAEMADRKRALAAQKRKAQEPEQLIVDDEVLCIECEELVSKPRLAAKPNAARCIECQSFYELKDRC